MPIQEITEKSGTNWDLLAALRFALAWIVACYHISVFFVDAGPVTRFTADLGAKASVIGFFLVSGYSIAASLSRGPRGFYQRRFLRIYPLYIFAVTSGCVLEYALHGVIQMPLNGTIQGSGLVTALGNGVFLQTFLVKPIAFDGPVWSLAVEAAYYVVAPVIVRLPRWCVLAIIIVSSVAYAAPAHDQYSLVYHAFTTFNMLKYAWAWFMGYYLFHNRKAAIVTGFALLGSALIYRNKYLNPEPLAVVTFLGSLLVIVVASNSRVRRCSQAGVSRVLTFLGDVSYPFYLLQFPILIAAYAFLGIRNGSILLALCLAGSVLAYYAIDVYLKQGLIRKIECASSRASFGSYKKRVAGNSA